MQQPQPMADVTSTAASAPATASTAAPATATTAAAASSTADTAAASSNPIPPAASASAAAPAATSSSAAAAAPATHKPRFGSLSGSAAASTSLVPPGPSVAPPPLWEPRSINLYKREGMSLIGEGTYGSVWLARAPNGTKVALKKIRKEKKEGFPITAIREIKILKQLKHPNIVVLKDVVSSHMPGKEGDVFMCFQFCDHDLTGLLESKVHISDALVKYYLRGILEGLLYLHKSMILHRDIKGANILISNNGEVRIADLGLARSMSKGGYTNRVVTLWYRAPELLLGSSDYDSKIDMWSVGCLMAELLTRGTVLFPGNSTELDQLNKVYDCCGVPQESNPNEENYWPGVSKLKYFQQFTPKPRKRMLRQMFASQKSQHAVNLLDKLLTLNPAQRFSAEQALDHEYFFEEPLPIEPHQHPQFSGNNHEYGSKQKRKEKEKNQGRPQQQQQQQQHMGGGGGGHPSAAAAASHSSALPNPYGHLNVMPHSMGAGLPGLHAPNVNAAAPSAQHHYDRDRSGGGGGALLPPSAALSHPPYPSSHGYHAPPAAPYGGHHGGHGAQQQGGGAGAYPSQQQGQYGQRAGGPPSQQQQHHRGGGDRGHDYRH